MKTKLVLCLLLQSAILQPAAAADKPGCKGDSLFTRMPETFVKDCLESDFDTQPFHCAPGRPATIEGRYLMTRYEAEKGAVAATPVQVLRNHKQAAGVGPLVPVTSNRGEPGRAKNRRVELVEQ